jgi:TatD DNase family protein
VTFPKAQGIREVAARVPLDSMLIETDAPFLAPLPHRGKRNEPAWVGRVADKLAEVCGVSAATVASSTTNNFFRFFGIAPGEKPEPAGTV